MKFLIPLAALLVSCSSSHPSPVPHEVSFIESLGRAIIEIDDYDRAASALTTAFRHVEPGNDSLLIVLHPSTPQEVAALFSRFGSVVSSVDVPVTANFHLPAGYLVIQELSVRDDEARFRAWAGPVSRGGGACGLGYDLPLSLSGETFSVTQYTLRVC